MNRERISFFENKLSSEPENIFHRFSLAQVLFDQCLFKDAIPHFLICLKKKPNWLIACLFLAKSEIQVQNYASAKIYLLRAISLAEEQNHDSPLDEAKKLLSDIKNFHE